MYIPVRLNGYFGNRVQRYCFFLKYANFHLQKYYFQQSSVVFRHHYAFYAPPIRTIFPANIKTGSNTTGGYYGKAIVRILTCEATGETAMRASVPNHNGILVSVCPAGKSNITGKSYPSNACTSHRYIVLTIRELPDYNAPHILKDPR